jgi:hypothetical protein
MRSDVLIVLTLKITIFWYLALCNLIDIYTNVSRELAASIIRVDSSVHADAHDKTKWQ